MEEILMIKALDETIFLSEFMMGWNSRNKVNLVLESLIQFEKDKREASPNDI